MSLAVAALRHRRDAALLQRRGRRENASQLYGFAAECALKFALIRFGLPSNALGEPSERRHRVHIQDFWDIATGFLQGRVGARLNSLLGAERPFAAWSETHRYRAITLTPDTVALHAEGARRALHVMDEARLLGCIP